MDIQRGGEVIGTVNFGEAGWGSSSAFKKELEGIGNIAYMGSDQHVQLIKNLTYSDLESI